MIRTVIWSADETPEVWRGREKELALKILQENMVPEEFNDIGIDLQENESVSGAIYEIFFNQWCYDHVHLWSIDTDDDSPELFLP